MAVDFIIGGVDTSRRDAVIEKKKRSEIRQTKQCKKIRTQTR